MKNYPEATRSIPDGTHVGAVDFVRSDNFTVEIPEEPGHYGSPSVHERVGSLPISMGDARRNIARSAFRLVNYRPLDIPA